MARKSKAPQSKAQEVSRGETVPKRQNGQKRRSFGRTSSTSRKTAGWTRAVGVRGFVQGKNVQQQKLNQRRQPEKSLIRRGTVYTETFFRS